MIKYQMIMLMYSLVNYQYFKHYIEIIILKLLDNKDFY